MPRSVPELLGVSALAPEPSRGSCCLCAGLPLGTGLSQTSGGAERSICTALFGSWLALLRCSSAGALQG